MASCGLHCSVLLGCSSPQMTPLCSKDICTPPTQSITMVSDGGQRRWRPAEPYQGWPAATTTSQCSSDLHLHPSPLHATICMPPGGPSIASLKQRSGHTVRQMPQLSECFSQACLSQNPVLQEWSSRFAQPGQMVPIIASTRRALETTFWTTWLLPAPEHAS